jgi:hypothetical protein
MATAPGSLNSAAVAAYFSLAGARKMVSNSIEDETNDEAIVSSVYPNPTSGLINIDGLQTDSRSIQILNTKGQIIKEVSVDMNSEKMSVDLKEYLPGLYLIRVLGDSGIKSFGVMKQ